MEKADVVIVGGGVFGCSIAYYYSRNNPEKKVVLLERNELNNAATSRAAAMMNVIRSKESFIPLAKQTYKAVEEMEEILDESMDIKRVGMMHVAASESRVRDLEILMELAKKYDQRAHYLTNQEAELKAPWLSAKEVLKVGYMPDEAYCDPYLLGSFYARCAKKQGAYLRQNVEVKNLIKEGNKVIGVNSSEGEIYCDRVVDAAGVWAPVLAKELGKGIPMAPVRSQYWITERSDIFPRASPMVLIPDAQAYARPEGGSLLFGLREQKSLVESPDEVPNDMSDYMFSSNNGNDDLIENGARLARFFPKFYDIGIQNYIAGFSGYTPDSKLVMGSVPGVEGFIVASGCCGSGIAVSGGVGLGIAELAAGRTNPFDFSEFALDRYGDIDCFQSSWLDKCAAARSNKVGG